jgi:hypothetical protein
MGRDIVIIPNRGLSGGTTHPEIRFSGLTDSSIKLKVEDDGSIVFDGNTGGLFEITDSKDGLLSAVSDVSGLPILAVYSDNSAGKWDDPGLTVINNQVFVGPTATTNASLYVSGNEEISGTLNIGTIGGGTPIGNLGFDSSGNVVTGTTDTFKYIEEFNTNLDTASVTIPLSAITAAGGIPVGYIEGGGASAKCDFNIECWYQINDPTPSGVWFKGDSSTIGSITVNESTGLITITTTGGASNVILRVVITG